MGLSNEDVRTIIRLIDDYEMSTRYAAERFGVTQRRIQQLVKEYRDTGTVPRLKRQGRNPYASYPDDIEERVRRAWMKLHMGAGAIAAYLRARDGIRIDNNRVHEILLEHMMARENDNKKGRKTPWIRYERRHSLSAMHMDWHENARGEWVCAVLDDASRMVLSCGEYEQRSAQAAIMLLDTAFQRYQHVRDIQQVITDHGAEFYANKRDKHGNASHSFEQYCKEHGIKQVLCRYNHPQSNGKLEKWFDTYETHRYRYDSLDDFIDWYNTVKPHYSLDFNRLETPEQAFWRKCRSVLIRNCCEMIEREVTKSETK